MPNKRTREEILNERRVQVYPYGEIWTDGINGSERAEVIVEDDIPDEILETVSEMLNDLWKQRDRIKHLIDVTHSTDTLTKLWSNYDSITNTILRIMGEYKIG